MYTKEEASKIKQSFWTAFGQYMQPIPAADGGRVNWSNYKTGIKHLYFRLDADKRSAHITLLFTQPNPLVRQQVYNSFVQLKNLFHQSMQEEWEWTGNTIDDYGKSVGKIYTRLEDVNIFNREDWPAIITFFKERMLALDHFWNYAKSSFDSLAP